MKVRELKKKLELMNDDTDIIFEPNIVEKTGREDFDILVEDKEIALLIMI